MHAFGIPEKQNLIQDCIDKSIYVFTVLKPSDSFTKKGFFTYNLYKTINEVKIY